MDKKTWKEPSIEEMQEASDTLLFLLKTILKCGDDAITEEE